MRTVLVTGGTKGIGLAIAEKFLNSDFKIIVLGRNFERFKLSSSNIQCIGFDLQNVEQIDSLVSQLGNVDILVNNAGVLTGANYKNYTIQQRDNILRVNLLAPIALMTAISAVMISNGGGRIVNNASVAGHTGHSDIWYGVTKAGLINATKSFAAELAPHAITVTAVATGPVQTEMLNRVSPSRMEMFRKAAYHDLFITPDEVANAVFWLATEAPVAITGTCLDLNDGVFPR